MSDLILGPLSYPLWWLLVSWFAWLLLRRVSLPRPSLPIMLIYSVSVAIEFIKAFRKVEVCIELCYPDFSLLEFLLDVTFWSVVLYVLMKWIARIDGVENYGTGQ
ncbi:MAG TPA: hypothetical protein VK249_18520 [Anaerolineales bacterium]|nr:hypothetical protein [Anaerolineales bacterium]